MLRLKKMKAQKAGLVVVAQHQTSGKGTNGRVWYTKSGENLTFSFLLRPNCDVKCFENLTIRIAETLVKVVKKLYGYSLVIKYPNDIVVEDKKLRRDSY